VAQYRVRGGHYETEVGRHLRAVSGLRGAQLLRRDEGEDVAFTSITGFTDLAAVRDFAGASCEQAVAEEAARTVLSRWDERVVRHEIAVHIPYLPGQQPGQISSELPAQHQTGGRKHPGGCSRRLVRRGPSGRAGR
jgi:hypothetical protein